MSDYILEQLIKRESTIKVSFRLDNPPEERLAGDFFDAAIAHTGEPAAGDYIKFQMGGYGADVEVSPDGSGGYIATVTYTVDFYTTAAQERLVDQKVAEIAEELGLDELDNFECVRAIYKYITSHVSYDYDHLEDDNYTLKYTAYAALFDGKAVCQGYAALFYRLANANYAYSRIISGTGGPDNGPHAWNIVRVGDEYYNIDCTWDAGKISGTYDWFMKCDANFPEHVRDAEYADEYFYETYPMAQEDYIVPPDFDDREYTSGYYSYKVDGAGNALITKYTGKESTVVVPAELDGYPVYAIGDSVFDENCVATTITLSEGIRGWFNNGGSAFMHCPNLTTVRLPSTVGVHDGSDYDIIAKNNRFFGCEKLRTITVASGNPYITSVNNVLFTKDMKMLIFYPMALAAASYVVPDGVVSIADCAFQQQRFLTSVELPDSLDDIGWFAFEDAPKLKNVTIPESCTYIGEWAFCGTAIETMYIPANVETIVAPAFMGASLKSITVSDGNPYYYVTDNVMFSKKTYGDFTVVRLECYPAQRQGKSYEIPDGVTNIGAGAFGLNTYLTSVTIPASVQIIEADAIRDCINLNRIDFNGTAEQWNAIDIWEGNEYLIDIKNGAYDLTGAKVVLSASSLAYTGKVRKPAIKTIGGNELEEGIDYTAKWSNASSKNVGTYTVTVQGTGRYRGSAKATYKIVKAANPLTIKPKTAAVKAKALKKKAQKLAVAKVLTFTKPGQGTVTYKLAGVTKPKFKKYFKVAAKTGKITIKKGLKKGTYKVKVKVTAAGNSNYNAVTKNVTFKVKVK